MYLYSSEKCVYLGYESGVNLYTLIFKGFWETDGGWTDFCDSVRERLKMIVIFISYKNDMNF